MKKMIQMMKMKRLKISGGKTLGDGVSCEKENLKTMVMVSESVIVCYFENVVCFPMFLDRIHKWILLCCCSLIFLWIFEAEN